MKKSWIVVLGIALSVQMSQAANFSIDHKLDGPTSDYTNRLIALAAKWNESPEAFRASHNGTPFAFKCVSTPGSPTYIGTERRMLINAPIARVRALIEGYEQYKKFIVGVANVKVLKREENKVIAAFEQEVPILPNIHYEMSYLENSAPNGRMVYRFQLRDGVTIRHNDGLIILEPTKDGKTYFAAHGFFDANWGLLTFSKERIWKRTTESVVLSDLLLMQQAEHPDWSEDQTRKAAEKLAESVPLAQIIESRAPATAY